MPPASTDTNYTTCLRSCSGTTPSPLPPCRTGVSAVACLQDPCLGQTCPGNPNARCVASYCGGCFPNWVDSNNNAVSNCNPTPTCGHTDCASCILDTDCTYCGASVTISGVTNAPTSVGGCFPVSYASHCLAAGVSVQTSAQTCVTKPVPLPVGGRLPPVPVDKLNVDVAAGTPGTSIAGKWTIVITLVDRQQASGNIQLANVFLNLIGSATPTPADNVAICNIVNKAISPALGVASSSLTCQLGTVTTGAKRDSNMVAVVSYPTSSGSARALRASLLLLAAVFLQ